MLTGADMRDRQSPRAILMVRPARFGFNDETAATNAFQTRPGDIDAAVLEERAVAEFDALVATLRRAAVEVLVVEDRPERRAPDAVFPNNWITMHPDGTVVLYPMCAPVRRLERRPDILTFLETYGFHVARVVDLSPHEREGRYLEGSGSLVFDYAEHCAYASLSPRTDPGLAREAAGIAGCDIMLFHAADAAGRDVYHTNVVLSIGEEFAVIASEAIEDAGERRAVLDRLRATGRDILEIDRTQMATFAANILEMENQSESKVVVMSNAAYLALRSEQIAAIEKHARIVASPLDTIETVGGGSARCMIASVHLPRTRPPGSGLRGRDLADRSKRPKEKAQS